MNIIFGNVNDGSESNHDNACRNVRYWTTGTDLFRKSMEETYGSSRTTDPGCAASGPDFTDGREGIRSHHCSGHHRSSECGEIDLLYSLRRQTGSPAERPEASQPASARTSACRACFERDSERAGLRIQPRLIRTCSFLPNRLSRHRGPPERDNRH